MQCWLAFHYTLLGACNQWWTRPHGSSLRHHATSMPITLAKSSMADWLQAGHPGLQMSSWPGSIIPYWQTSSSRRVGVSKASAFRFIVQIIRSSYPILNLRRPSMSSCHCTDLEQSSAAYHICSITFHLLLSLEDTSSNSVTYNYCCHAREVTLSFTDTLINQD